MIKRFLFGCSALLLGAACAEDDPAMHVYDGGGAIAIEAGPSSRTESDAARTRDGGDESALHRSDAATPPGEKDAGDHSNSADGDGEGAADASAAEAKADAATDASVGTSAPSPDASVDAPCVPTAETCDDLDNDCDGQVDEGLTNACGGPCGATIEHEPGSSCTAGVGECARAGLYVCVSPTLVQCNAMAGEPAQEICDDKDNDCNEEVDEGDACTLAPPTRAVDVSAGGEHTCARLEDESTYCWGSNQHGQLGRDEAKIFPFATRVPLAEVTGVTAGGHHTCVQIYPGAVRCFGGNGKGQVGDGTNETRFAPVLVQLPETRELTAGGDRTCALTPDSAIYCWGVGSYAPASTPRIVSIPASGLLLYGLATGPRHSCILAEGGSISCWSVPGAAGRIVHEDNDLSDVQELAAGDDHSCARTVSRSVVCWGANDAGQLGTGNSVAQPTKVDVAGVRDVVELDAGARHTCARLSTGAVMCWGANDRGQLGSGRSSEEPTAPVLVEGLDTAVAISAGDHHTCAVLASGGVQCWGANGAGQLGDKSTESRTRPVSVRWSH